MRTPEVSHTSNEWKQIQGGAWEISNRVYQMRYQFTPVPHSKAVRVTWGIVYNTPQQPGNPRYANSWGDSRYIARQDKKQYDNAEAAQWYIQGRFDLYAHLFTELSPPVPNDCKRMFMVNGHLLPGYTLAPPERTKEEAVNDLLRMEGGKYALTLFSELLQELLDEGNISGAASVVRKLHEAAEIPSEESALNGGSNVAWFPLFSGVLGDTLEDAVP